MRRQIAILILILTATMALAGCGGKDPLQVQAEFLAMTEEPETQENIEAIEVFLDDNLGYLDEEEADLMLISLEDYAFSPDSHALYFRDLAGRYEGKISDALYDLYILMAEEQESPAVVDATLKISWEALCHRALTLETYIRENKDYEPVKRDAAWLYETYINEMLMGATKSPIFDYDTGEFSQEAYQVYETAAAEQPDTVTAWVISQYFEYLDQVSQILEYKDAEQNKLFFDTCNYLVSEAGKRVYQ